MRWADGKFEKREWVLIALAFVTLDFRGFGQAQLPRSMFTSAIEYQIWPLAGQRAFAPRRKVCWLTADLRNLTLSLSLDIIIV